MVIFKNIKKRHFFSNSTNGISGCRDRTVYKIIFTAVMFKSKKLTFQNIGNIVRKNLKKTRNLGAVTKVMIDLHD